MFRVQHFKCEVSVTSRSTIQFKFPTLAVWMKKVKIQWGNFVMLVSQKLQETTKDSQVH
jgi:hypothetical protein